MATPSTSDPSHPPPSGKPRRLRRWRRRLAVWSCLYLAWIVACFGCHVIDSAVMFPTTNPIAVRDATARLIPRSDHNGSVQVWIARSNAAATTQPAAYVLEFTGNATRAEEIVDSAAWAWGDRPIEVWAVNFPGYGESTGPARMKAVATTALDAYDALRDAAQGRPIFVVGTSLGTTAALHVAAERPVAGAVLVNPPALPQLIRNEYGWWNLWLLSTPASWCVPGELDSIRNAAKVRAPAVCVTSMRDTTVPQKYQQRVIDAYAGPKQVIVREADHNDAWSGSEERQLAQGIDWLWSRTMPAK